MLVYRKVFKKDRIFREVRIQLGRIGLILVFAMYSDASNVRYASDLPKIVMQVRFLTLLSDDYPA